MQTLTHLMQTLTHLMQTLTHLMQTQAWAGHGACLAALGTMCAYA